MPKCGTKCYYKYMTNKPQVTLVKNTKANKKVMKSLVKGMKPALVSLSHK
jgi:hypothetical protein